MDDPIGENGFRGFSQLVLILTASVLVLIFLAGLIWYGTLPATPSIAPTLTQLPSATASATPSASHTPTRRPTWTLRPSLTASFTPLPEASRTPTPDRLPTLVKARPNQYNDNYVLATWDAEKASEAARRMREYPDVLFKKVEDRQSQSYQDAFIYATLLYQEALLRYPDDSRVASWRWGLAYSLARLGDARAVALYTSLLQEALKAGSLPLSRLPVWFAEHEPSLTLKIHSLPNTPGQLGQSLLELEGGVFIWLLHTPEQIFLHPLTAKFDFRARPNDSGTPIFLSSDLTGDAIPELVIFIATPTGEFTSTDPLVFDLSQNVPVQLPVSQVFPVDFKQAYMPSLQSSNQPGRFNLSLKFFPACPVVLTRAYTWNGVSFLPEELELSFTLPEEELQRCETILSHVETYWEPRLAAAISNALLPVWPPALDLQGRNYPDDAHLALLYRHAVSSALAGDQAAAMESFQQILDDPEGLGSEWRIAAEAFLTAYQTPAGIYHACLAAPDCDPSIALRQLTQSSGISDVALAQEFLRSSGVTLRSAGIFDFDLDGVNERWITVQHRPGDRLQFWILAPGEKVVQAIYLGDIETNAPTVYFSTASPGIPVFQLAPRQGYRLLRHADSGLAFLLSVPVDPALTTYTRDALFAAEVSLFSGVSPNEVRHDLELVLQSGRFNCRTHAICDRFYYLLGLVYELNDQPRAAIDTYLKLWWENASSPLTTVARLKLHLIQIIKPTATRTSSPQPYPTVNPYIEPGPTTSPTPYPTPDFSGYPTP